MDGQALEGGHGCHDHVIAVIVTGDKAVGLAFRQLDMADEIPRARRDEPQGDDAIRVIREKNVSGQLLLDKAPIRLVSVQRPNDVIAVWPGIRPRSCLCRSHAFRQSELCPASSAPSAHRSAAS